jgi:chemotaxis protein methyltransferase CheR
MSGDSHQETLALFAKFLARTMGLHFAQDRLPELQAKMASLGRQAGYADPEEYLLWLMSAPLPRQLLETLALNLTIGETYFLRDPKSYQALEEELLPGLIAARRSTGRALSIWSAGCASGEEPYTLAILLSRIIPDLANWKITLLATDINPQALERGRLGVYSQWSFRNAPAWLMDYFTKREDGRFEVIPRIREMVRFSHLNLADPEEMAKSGDAHQLDIIFCRNVMLYFDAEQVRKTMAMLHAALKDTGWLFLGPTDVDHHTLQGFSSRHYDGAFVLSKIAVQPTEEPVPEPAVPATAPASPAPGATKARVLSDKLPFAAAPRHSTAPTSTLPSDSRKAEPPGELAGALEYAEALSLYQAGRYQHAADLALHSLEAGGERVDALALSARAYANIGRFAEARKCCEKAIGCDRLRAPNHYLLSIILEQQGDLAGAMVSLQHALFVDHDYLLAYFALGNLKRRCGDQVDSQRNFANALRLLERRHPHEVLPEAEGMTAGRLAEIIRAMTTRKREQPAFMGG